MSTFVLIPGASGSAWYWHRLVPLLERAGHDAIAVDLPGDDEQAGLPEYAGLVVDGVAGHDDVVLVAQSLGGFTAPLAATKVPVGAVVLVNAMVPAPHESPGDWWANTDWETARIAAAKEGGYSPDFSLEEYFLHDVPPDVAAAGEAYQRPEADAVFESVCDFDSWPPVPTRVVAGADDRFFPVEFQRRVAHERLGLEATVLPGGHLLTLSHPAELADYLLGL